MRNNKLNEINDVISHIKNEWNQEINYIKENGFNGYNIKRLKETKMLSGHAELENNNKLLIYGNAIKVINQEDFFNKVECISISYFNIDLVLNKRILEKLKYYKKLKKLIFSNNNIHSYFQIIKFEETNNFENIEIINNEICKSSLLKYFLIYRFQYLKIVSFI